LEEVLVRATDSAKKKAAAAARSMRLHHYATLLAAELILILVYPFLVGMKRHDESFRLVAIIVFCTSLYAVMGRGRVTVIALALGAPAIVLRLFNLLHGHSYLKIPDEILGLVFLFYVTSVLVWSILKDPSVTTDTLAGAISAYFLLGISFGVAYMTIETMIPGSFKDTLEAGKVLSPSEFTFFSFVTLTTTGYGDIVPWGPHARALAIVESVIGVMYPAVLIGRLVGMHGRKHEDS
jgi:hypothetical protein